MKQAHTASTMPTATPTRIENPSRSTPRPGIHRLRLLTAHSTPITGIQPTALAAATATVSLPSFGIQRSPHAVGHLPTNARWHRQQ